MITSTRERRDWTLLIFIIPIGVILMLIAGQVAIRLVPIWSVDAGMQSKLDPSNLPKQQSGLVQPVLPAILTPLGWFDTFLTPGAGSDDQNVAFPAFVVFEPSATPAFTSSPPPTVVTPSPIIPVTGTSSPTVVVTPSASGTPKPPVNEETPIPPTIVTTPPTVVPPPIVDPPVVPPIVVVPPPEGINIGPGDNKFVDNIHWLVIDLGLTPIVVSGDTNYDIVYYEISGCAGICMDEVVIGISNDSNGISNFTVFYWGNSAADMNSNVGVVSQTDGETDNQPIVTSVLYGDPYQTGIAIDVDNSLLSEPPLGSYRYIVITSPTVGDGLELDAVQVIELPNPLIAGASITAVDGQSASPAAVSTAEEVPIVDPVVDQVSGDPVVEEAPAESVVEAPAEPVVEVEAPVEPVAEAEVPAEPVDTAPAEPAVEEVIPPVSP